MNTEELSTRQLMPPLLDYWVARCEQQATGDYKLWAPYSPSTDQAEGGKILDRESITTFRGADDKFGHQVWGAIERNIQLWGPGETAQAQDWLDCHISDCVTGPTRLIAAMRCHVLAYYGEKVPVVDFNALPK